ncbi:MAG: 3-hydroxyacyl-[acyl-carrier-protein] dehydratase FabZ [Gammaproteobacteria bacterium]|nr:3-hydroxyacyl-[acyl-carrier-protein] dehydratase FabZ [Gammaproteobacteria bacterium]
MDIHEIKNYLPHRYPFLLIDRVTRVEQGELLKAYKNVTFNEPFFQGHFPHRPIMPGVLIVEAMAQACAILASYDLGEGATDKRVYYFTGIDSARFKTPVEPGDRLDFDVTILRRIKNMWKCGGEAKVGDRLCCSAQLMFTYKDMS